MTAVSRPRIALFASGRGSNFDSIVTSIRNLTLSAEPVALVCDRPDALVLAKAHNAGIPVLLVTSEKGQDRRDFDQKVLDLLMPYRPEFLVMAGYMRIVTPTLLEPFRAARGFTKVTNIHPSLLPAFPGVHSYAQAYRHGCKISGVTVHLVEEEVDSGPICTQEAFQISQCKSEKEVESLGLAIEHRLYPETLSWILAERFEVEMREAPMQSPPHPTNKLESLAKSQELSQAAGREIKRRLCVRPN